MATTIAGAMPTTIANNSDRTRLGRKRFGKGIG
jgi:hypothetical protein